MTDIGLDKDGNETGVKATIYIDDIPIPIRVISVDFNKKLECESEIVSDGKRVLCSLPSDRVEFVVNSSDIPVGNDVVGKFLGVAWQRRLE